MDPLGLTKLHWTANQRHKIYKPNNNNKWLLPSKYTNINWKLLEVLRKMRTNWNGCCFCCCAKVVFHHVSCPISFNAYADENELKCVRLLYIKLQCLSMDNNQKEFESTKHIDRQFYSILLPPFNGKQFNWIQLILIDLMLWR